MKIYTKTGDKGETGLVGGKRISKAALRIQAYGDVDETNAAIGLVKSFLDSADTDVSQNLTAIQNDLFVIGAELATPMDYHGKRDIPKIGLGAVRKLEDWIDHYDSSLPKLQHFILPSGGKAGAFLHFARTVCRRAEREVVRFSKEEPLRENILVYLNRLSDLLFVLARVINGRQSQPEIPWVPS